MTAAVRAERRERRRTEADQRRRHEQLRARSDAMTAARERRERRAEVERRLDALRQERDAALRRYASRLRLELHHALAALRAARGEERVHPLAPYAIRAVPGDPIAVEDAEAAVALIRAALAEQVTAGSPD